MLWNLRIRKVGHIWNPETISPIIPDVIQDRRERSQVEGVIRRIMEVLPAEWKAILQSHRGA